METDFWHQKWQKNEIGFHQSKVNRFLAKHLADLSLPTGGRVFLPLCGKTLDIAWLLENGYQVVGAELVETAIKQLFVELKIEPQVTKQENMLCYSAKNIDMWIVDIFDLNKETLGSVDAVYDRAALVALPKTMRDCYTAHLTKITQQVPQLLITFEYDQELMPGPPFSIIDQEVHEHYQQHYQLTLLESADVPGGLKGKCPALEKAWLLHNN